MITIRMTRKQLEALSEFSVTQPHDLRRGMRWRRNRRRFLGSRMEGEEWWMAEVVGDTDGRLSVKWYALKIVDDAKPFSEMTADEIAAHREAWRRGEAEMWRGRTKRRSRTTGDWVYSDHDAPTEELCAAALRRAVLAHGHDGSIVDQGPKLVTPHGDNE